MSETLPPPPQVTLPLPATLERPARWSGLRRVAFRFNFSYWVLYALLNGNLTLLVVTGPVGAAVAVPGAKLAQWVGAHVFHLTGLSAKWHGGGSGDTALDQVRVLCLALVAVVATIVWSILDARRPNYRALLLWLRWLLRLTLGASMLCYGFAKLFPLQMRPPSLGILTNTFGNSSPMTLLWTLLGLNPLYQMVCGAAEVAAGLLLLLRRTATLGAILALALTVNIVLYNFFFDVPVKLFASHLLLMGGYLLLPDLPPLWRLFVRLQPAQLTVRWTPPVRTAGRRKGLIIAEAGFALVLVVELALFTGRTWRQHRAALTPTPITGAWEVDSPASEIVGAHLVSPEDEPWSALYIDDQRAGFYRSRDGELWRCGFQYDGAIQKLGIHAPGEIGADYFWQVPDPDHLVLSRNIGGRPVKISFHRVGPKEGFPLVQRSFHWITEWGYER